MKANLSPKHIKKYHLYLLQVGFPLAISSLSIVIYTRIDQIMLAKYLGSYSVSLYSAAHSITQGWAIIPSALVTSMMSTIIRKKSSRKADKLIHLLYVIAISTFVPVFALVSLMCGPIIDLIYGKAYHAAAGILLIGAFTTCVSVMGTVAYRVIIMNAGFRFVAIKMLLIAVLNIALNSYLIPLYGIEGAAFATLLSEFSSLFILNAFFRKGFITSQIFFSFQRKYSISEAVFSLINGPAQQPVKRRNPAFAAYSGRVQPGTASLAYLFKAQVQFPLLTSMQPEAVQC